MTYAEPEQQQCDQRVYKPPHKRRRRRRQDGPVQEWRKKVKSAAEEPKTDGNKPETETQQTGKDQCDQSDYYVGEIVTLGSDQDQCDQSDYRPEETSEQDHCDHCDYRPDVEIDWGLILDPGGSWRGVHTY